MKITSIALEPALLERIEDVRFTRRFPSRNQAIAKILEVGIAAMTINQEAANVRQR